MTMEILKVQDLCKTYRKGEAKVEALKKVSFSLDKGEFAAVVGESGSGKSTLLNCIGALDTPTSGHIWVDEHHQNRKCHRPGQITRRLRDPKPLLRKCGCPLADRLFACPCAYHHHKQDPEDPQAKQFF